jgi:phosphatidylglycerol:prolipoprotein diacylglycerol transferase
MLPDFRIGPTIIIRSYALMLDVAIIVGLLLLGVFGALEDDERPAAWVDAGLGALVGGIIGGRLGHVGIHWRYFAEHPEGIVKVWQGGLDWHGAVLVGLLALLLVCRIRGVNTRQISDALAFILPMGAALVNTGCLMVSCGHGREVASLADYRSPIVLELPDLYGVVAPRLASQLYGVAFSLLLIGVAGLLAWRIAQAGVRCWLVLALLALGTFGIGFTRGDSVPMVGALRLDQVLDLLVTAGALATAVLAARPIQPETVDLPTWPAQI